MNILKIVSHKRCICWHLSTEIKTQIYKSLVRPLLEYSSIIYSTLSNALKDILNAVQYNALRIIFEKDRKFGNKNLLMLAKVEPLKVRMRKLELEFIRKAIEHKNPIICDIINEYKTRFTHKDAHVQHNR